MKEAAEQTWDIIVHTEGFEVIKTSSKAVFDQYIAHGFCGMAEPFRDEVYPSYHCPEPVAKLIASAVAILLTIGIVIVAVLGSIIAACDSCSSKKKTKETPVVAPADVERGEHVPLT
ncbi:hypothetical protein B0T14DRAFT_566904 [Immersiella caudata]|uniref:Uncharacterized protein n=1 Tax=Immersiella caudata TaxID=314043 RepID=A0AA39WR94_9PEZI|nr:hypothetical protein B0T14DRAFT_566904 [Immersiella caudata]